MKSSDVVAKWVPVRFRSPLRASSKRGLTLVALFSLVLVGCDSRPALYPVKGTVSVDGKPASGASLLFHPTSVGIKSVSSAIAKEDGSFEVVTDSMPGIAEGEYIVTLTWPDPAHKPSEQDVMMGLAEPGKDLLNSAYVMRDKSQIRIQITSTTTQIPAIELKTR